MLQSVEVDRETGDGDVLMQQLVNTDRLVGTKEKKVRDARLRNILGLLLFVPIGLFAFGDVPIGI